MKFRKIFGFFFLTSLFLISFFLFFFHYPFKNFFHNHRFPSKSKEFSKKPLKHEKKLENPNENPLRNTEIGKIQYSNQRIKEEAFVMSLIDPAYNKQWGHQLTEIKKAWIKHKTLGHRNIVVAIIDTGIDMNHIDLRNNLWVNKGESGIDKKGRNKASNGIDDDGNGFIDDIHGWNFATHSNQLKDVHGHGTHIAGIIGAEAGNGVGIQGVAPKVSLMILNYYDQLAPQKNLFNTIRAIRYAVKMNASIINYSGGGLDPSEEEKQAILEAEKKGILFIAASGNEKSNIDIADYYPADYPMSNILSVTAIDKSKTVLPSSNYGAHSVDIAAPGNRIFSTLPGDRYGYMTGTSQATAFVTGVAALILSHFSDFNAQKVIRHLTQTGDYDDEKLVGKTRYKKRLNAFRALAILDSNVNVMGSAVQNSPYLDDTFAGQSNHKDPLSELSSTIKIIKKKSSKD